MKTKFPSLTLTGTARCLAASALAFFITHSAQAANDFWIAVPGVSADTNWSDSGNWSSPNGGTSTSYNQVEFLGTGASANNNFAVNNVADQVSGYLILPIWELDYVPTNGNYTTLINPGIALELGAGQGHLMVGADINTPGSPATAGAVETIKITGPGASLEVGGSLNVGQGSPTDADGHNVTLDLSGLDNYAQNSSAFGGNPNANWLYVAGSNTVYSGTGPIRSNGTLDLAKTNAITLNQDFEICNQAYSNSLPCAVYLGAVNSISVGGNLIVAGSGTTTVGAWMKFNSAFLGGATAPTASFTGSGGGRISNFWICNGNAGPETPGYGLCDFSGGNVSMLVNSMELGQAGTANAQGVLTLDNGFVSANSAVIGNQEDSGGGAGVGIVNLNSNATYGASASLIVNNALTLGEVTGTAAAGTAGTININGGSLTAGSIVNGGGTAAINVTNGALTVSGQAGTAVAPLNTVSIVGSTITLPESSSANMTVSSLTTGGKTNIINISVAAPSHTFPVQVTLIKYSGGIGGAGYNFGVGTLPALTTGYISNNVANSSVDLVLTSGPSAETWTASVNGNWDTTTANWLAGGVSATYANGAFVQFFDGASSGTVNLTAALSPGGLTVSNNTLNYTFDGSGYLTGGSELNKLGTGTLVMDNSGINALTGGVNIGAGVLQVGNNDGNGNLPAGGITNSGALVFDQTGTVANNNPISGSGSLTYEGGGTLNVAGGNTFSGSVLVTSNSTLQLGGSSALGLGISSVVVASGSTLDGNGNTANRPIIVSGTGVGGNGALTDSGGAIYDSSGGISGGNTITLAGDTTFDFPNRWDVGSGVTLSTTGNPYNLTLNGSTYFEFKNVTMDPALANIDLQAGSMGIVGTTTFGNPADVLTIQSGAALVFYGGSANFMNKGVDFQSGGFIDNNGGNNVMTGAMTLEPGFCQFTINGGTLTVSNVMTGSGVFYMQSGSGTVIIGGNSPAFTGGVSLYDGQVTLNGLVGSTVTSQSGTTLAGSGTADGLVDIFGGFLPGNANSGATFNAAGGLTLENNAGITNGLAATVAGTSDLTVVTGNLTASGNTIYINPFSGQLQSGAVYPIITYTGTLTGSFAGAQTLLPTAYTFTLTNITSTVPHQIAVIVGGSAANLTWNNGSGNGQWDVLSSDNWTDRVNKVEEQFNNGDSVVLDDSITNAAAPNTNITVASGTVLPGLVAINNSAAPYSLSGLGSIGDGASLVKTGTNALNIAMTNTYAGNTVIGAGTVKITGQFSAGSSPLGSSAGSVIISNGASLIINLTGGYSPGDSGFGPKPIIVSGAGANGQGAIQNVGNALYDDSSTLGLGFNVTMTGNTTIGAQSRLDWGFPGDNTTLSTGGSNYNLTVTFGAGSEWDELLMDTNLGNIDIYTYGSAETWSVDAMGGSLGNPTNILTLHSNLTMAIGLDSRYAVPAAASSGYAKVVHVLPTATWRFQPSGGPGDYRLNTSFIFENGASMFQYSVNGGTGSGLVYSGPVTLNGLVHMQIGNAPITFSNVISGAGGFYVDNYGGNPLVFTAADTYQGITDLRSGIELSLNGNGSISDSTPISLASGAVLAVTNRVDGTLTLTSGQTLEGSGTVAGNLVAGAGTILLPGITSTGTNVGLLTVSGNATLGGSALFKVNSTTNDVLSVGGALTYGGTLTLTNLTPLAGGRILKLFNAASYSGSFSSISPATPGPGLFWITNNLAVNGTITVGQIKINRIVVSGTTLTLTGTGPASTPYVLMDSTNLLRPLPWTPVLTNAFTSGGLLNLSTNIVNANIPDEYYILQVP
jgi:fibronectin-binding autotransporter adhesin